MDNDVKQIIWIFLIFGICYYILFNVNFEHFNLVNHIQLEQREWYQLYGANSRGQPRMKIPQLN